MEIGALVADRYLVTDRLGRGGMAEVVKAHDRRLARDVALKVVHGPGATDRRRFDAETRLLASFQHPHLVRVFDAGVHDGDPYLVLELAAGPTLADLLAAAPLADDRLRSLGRDLAGALAHIHAEDVVHRDVKPANVLTDGEGRWLLADFGIARLVDATSLTATGAAIGTPAYLAPEQLTGEQVTPAVDVYALGLTLLEAATGSRAFPGPGTEAAMARLAQDPDVSAAPAAWQGLLAAMTARTPEDRPTAATVARRLADDAAAVPTEPVPLATAATTVTATATLPLAEPVAVAAPAGRGRPAGPHPWLGIVAALFVLALVTVGAFAWLGGDGAGEATAATSTTAPAPTTAVTVPVTTAAPVVSPPPSTAPTTPTTPTTTDPCPALEDQLDQLRAQQDALRDRAHGNGHDRGQSDAKHQLDEQRREVERQLHDAHC